MVGTLIWCQLPIKISSQSLKITCLVKYVVQVILIGMLVDGKALAAQMYIQTAEQVARLDAPPRLIIITTAPNLGTKKYLELKEKKAAELQIKTTLSNLPETCTTDDLCQAITDAVSESDGILVQLPLPVHIDTDKVLAAIPASHDVDVINYDGTSALLPPVVGAIAAIAHAHAVAWADVPVTVVGCGRLVGAPVARWVETMGAKVTTITVDTPAAARRSALAAAEIIITGAGVPGLITPEQVSAGVVVFDAGASELNGALQGDFAPSVAHKASLFTPVPGGIGPLTVVCMFANLVKLVKASA